MFEELLSNTSLYFIVLLVLVVILFYVFNKIEHIIDNYKSRKNIKEILCVPSGEVIKIKESKFFYLTNKGIINWNGKTRYYCFDDKYSYKYKVK